MAARCPGFEAVILDERLKPVADGETGQLALRGPGMFAGYLNPPKRREEVLRDGWFLTGDLAHRDDAGRIVIDGRLKTVIDVAGHKVFPEEVAAVLDQHPAVLRSRVTTRPHPQLGEAVHAEVQLRDGSSPTVSRRHPVVLPPPALEPQSADLARFGCRTQSDFQRKSAPRLTGKLLRTQGSAGPSLDGKAVKP